jgi:hypothetical protein
MPFPDINLPFCPVESLSIQVLQGSPGQQVNRVSPVVDGHSRKNLHPKTAANHTFLDDFPIRSTLKRKQPIIFHPHCSKSYHYRINVPLKTCIYSGFPIN